MALWADWADYAWRFRWEPGVTFLADWNVAIGSSIGYCILVYGMAYFMRNQARFEMKTFSLIHNINMFLISVFCFIGLTYGVYLSYQAGGIEILFCDAKNRQHGVGVLKFWMHIFWLSKIYEFVDTIIIVLRKAPLIFLHVYHHWITNLLVFFTLYYAMPTAWSACVLNAFVHIPMYLYYLLSIAGFKDLWFKRYITQIQIMQFITVLLLHLTSVLYHYYVSQNCSSFDVWWKNTAGGSVIASYLLLFLHFYSQSYGKDGKKKAAPAGNGSNGGHDPKKNM